MNFFDLHCDTPYECYVKKQEFLENTLAVSGEKGKIFDKWHQCFAVWIRDDLENPFGFYKKVLTDFKGKTTSKPDNLKIYMTVEGGALLEDDFDRLYELKNDGIRLLTLTWNGKNRIASGAFETGGLTDFGREVIEKAGKLNIGCDLAHLNRESFFGAIEYVKCPVVTHTACDAVYSHKRNLTDEQCRLTAQCGGLIGLCVYPDFLGTGDVFENIYRHIYHLLDMGIEDNISFGTDFDGAKMDQSLSDISKIPMLYEYLLERIKDKTVLSKIFFENAEKFFINL